MSRMQDFPSLVSQFNFEGELISVEPYGIGHINDTYVACFKLGDGAVRRYILQKINQHVFKKPEILMGNIEAVTKHLRRKVVGAGGDPERETLTLIPTIAGKAYHKTVEGEYWRGYIFIEHARTYQIPESRQHVVSAAYAFGRFQQMLSDFPIDQLHDTIPDFHNTPKRYDAFIDAVEKDIYNRASQVKEEIDFVTRRADDMPVLIDLIERGILPVRVIHNDTKYNNVMIDDATGESVCVIDLDTVMRGSALFDFGDAIRSITNTAEEDQPDLSRVRFSLDTFHLFTMGYLKATLDAMTQAEIDHLAFSARVLTLECGMRFLTDFLQGDVYYHTQHPNHNLDRSRTQFKLVQEMEANFDRMVQIVQDTIAR